MFDQLFERLDVLERHRAGPLFEERCAFLLHHAHRGLSRNTLQAMASRLMKIVARLKLTSRAGKIISRDEIQQAFPDCYKSRLIATRLLRFLSRLELPPVLPDPFARKIKAFADYMEHERGLATATILARCWFIPRFLRRLQVSDGSLRGITPNQIDEALKDLLGQNGYSRITIQGWASVLRSFFRFAEEQGWCRKGLAATIRSPRVFAQASLPVGPSWDDVRRLLATTEGDRRADIRNRPIIMLLAIYGLRAGEVNNLRVDDFDWERESFSVVSSKTRRLRTYPLTRALGDAILRYLRDGRPRSSHREMFLTLVAPVRPLRHALWPVVATRLQLLNPSLPHYGPHALRHACATRLVAQGSTLKEIGDLLGHSDPDTTRIYAKVDLVGLREVADFDLGGLV